MDKHTNEPWIALPPNAGSHFDSNWHVTDSNDTFVAHVLGFNHQTDDQCAANARRIAACVNACAGIRTEDLERYYNAGGGIDEAMEEASLRGHVSAVKERDRFAALNAELLSELEKAHVIIRNALKCMSPPQKSKWGDINERDYVDAKASPAPTSARR